MTNSTRALATKARASTSCTMAVVLLTSLAMTDASAVTQTKPTTTAQGDTEVQTQPQAIAYETLPPLWQTRLKVSCYMFDNNDRDNTTCIQEKVDRLSEALVRRDEPRTKENRHFWYLVEDLIQSLVVELPFHPECLDHINLSSLARSEAAEAPSFRCESDYKSEIEAYDTRAFLAEMPLSPNVPFPHSNGYIYFRIAQREFHPDQGVTYWIDLIENGGGTGNFASIWQFYQPPDQRFGAGTFEVQHTIYGGDRCDRGRMETVEVINNRLTFKAAITPFGLLNPDGPAINRLPMLLEALENSPAEGGIESTLREITSREEGTFMNWYAYSDVVNANGGLCGGQIIQTRHIPTGETWLEEIAVNAHIAPQQFFHNPKLVECGGAWLQSITEQANGEEFVRFRPTEWLIKREELRGACEGVGP